MFFPIAAPSIFMLGRVIRETMRLYLSRMIRFTSVMIASISMFTVVKSQVIEGGKVVKTILRPVWDMRPVNFMWHDTPWVSMGSPSCFSHVDLSGLPERKRLGTFTGDVPHYFYVLRNPDLLLPFFCFRDFTAQEFCEYA